MDFVEGFLLITLVHTLSVAAPGPDFILVSQQALVNGKKAGLLCSIGIALGLSVHIIYSALGLAALITSSLGAMWVIKILGGSYLIYLGVKGLRARPSNVLNIDHQPIKQHSLKRSLLAGFLCNVLNPKAAIYFLALFTVVLSPEMPLYQLAIYGVWMMILQFLWFALVTLVLSQPLFNKKFKRMGHWIDRVLGGAMIALGLKLMFARTN